MSVYLHHLCLFFLAGTDTVFRSPSLMSSWGDTSTTTPRRESGQMRGGVSCIHPFKRSTRSIHQPRRRQSPPTVKGLPLGGSRDLPPPGGRIPGRRYTPRLPLWPMDTPVLPGSRRILGTAVEEPNLGQKPKLGGVRALLPFHCIFRWFAFIFLQFCLFFFVLFVCKKPKKISPF